MDIIVTGFKLILSAGEDSEIAAYLRNKSRVGLHSKSSYYFSWSNFIFTCIPPNKNTLYIQRVILSWYWRYASLEIMINEEQLNRNQKVKNVTVTKRAESYVDWWDKGSFQNKVFQLWEQCTFLCSTCNELFLVIFYKKILHFWSLHLDVMGKSSSGMMTLVTQTSASKKFQVRFSHRHPNFYSKKTGITSHSYQHPKWTRCTFIKW